MSHRKLSKAKLAILGGSKVGKTALVVRYLTKRFIGEYDQKRCTLYSQRVNVRKDDLLLDILDTSSEDCDAVLETNVKAADGFILMFSVTDTNTFQQLSRYKRCIDKYKPPGTPMVLVGNKTDLTHHRLVENKVLEKYAHELECPFYEISVSESYDDVREVVEEVVLQIKSDFVKNLIAMEKRSVLLNMTKSLRKRMMLRSRSETV